ncbi:Hpt domain-containing protein [Hyphomonas chukchiensis]|uniref:HPt domain-containing protein n=1 Tax=Hyphomonas chukchiensis TaxID=1280947 RepID=A0A062UAH0_9PROT|nr:Hpt domain-containing protein [Hyphomonas chukchiensis]KCZ55302.1 hypothetical protein HY30_09060 [Hyphomonas chukchiensis]
MKKLIGKLLGAKSGKSVETKQMATPDISRVIKMPAAPPVTAAEIPAPAPEPELAPETADPNELADRAEAAVDAMASQFDAWMEADLHRLMDAWQEAKQPGATPEAYRTVFMCAHNIRGAAGSYGYPAISRLCGSLCTLLSETHPGENAALINLHIEACRAAFIGAGKGDTSQSMADAVCDALEQSVAAKAAHK